MDQRFIGLRIDEDLWIKYKMICVEKKLSLPKQTAQLIEQFIVWDQRNKDLLANKYEKKKQGG